MPATPAAADGPIDIDPFAEVEDLYEELPARGPDTRRFWLRGGRLRVTGPTAALARAERRLAARWSQRRGRRL
jgi:hypothetical protein